MELVIMKKKCTAGCENDCFEQLRNLAREIDTIFANPDSMNIFNASNDVWSKIVTWFSDHPDPVGTALSREL